MNGSASIVRARSAGVGKELFFFFTTTSRPALGSTQLSTQWVLDPSPYLQNFNVNNYVLHRYNICDSATYLKWAWQEQS